MENNKVITRVVVTILDLKNSQARPWWQFWGGNPNEEKAKQIVDTAEKVANAISTTATVLSVLWEVGSKAKHWLDEYMRARVVPQPPLQLTSDNNVPKTVGPSKPDLSIGYTPVFYQKVKTNNEILGESDPDLADFTPIVAEEDVPAATTLQRH